MKWPTALATVSDHDPDPARPPAATSRLRRTWPQRLLLTFNLLLIAAALATAGTLAYLQHKLEQIPRVAIRDVLDEPEGPSGPQNYLLVGTDSASGLDPDDPVTIGRDGLSTRSDTIMVLRVEPEAEDAAILSFPRDLWVPIAGGGEQRINTALAAGGPEALIETIQGHFGIPINHYLQVDLAGFGALVEAVDGVPIFFDTPVRDPNTGLHVGAAGCVTLEPDQALAFARSRHYERFVDGAWTTDPSGDLGRISRQQHFVRRALERAVAKGVRNPSTLGALVDVGLANLTVDDALTPDDVLAVGRRFRSFDPAELDASSPEVVDRTVGAAQVLAVAETPANEALFDRFRGVDDAEGTTPASVRVEVQNGSGATGEAATVAEAVADAGFIVTGQGDADAFDRAETTVRHAPGQEGAADLLARWLEAPVVLEEAAGLEGSDVVLVTGRDFAGVRAEPTPAPADEPAISTSTTAAAPEPEGSAPSSTVIGAVPAEPADDQDCG